MKLKSVVADIKHGIEGMDEYGKSSFSCIRKPLDIQNVTHIFGLPFFRFVLHFPVHHQVKEGQK